MIDPVGFSIDPSCQERNLCRRPLSYPVTTLRLPDQLPPLSNPDPSPIHGSKNPTTALSDRKQAKTHIISPGPDTTRAFLGRAIPRGNPLVTNGMVIRIFFRIRYLLTHRWLGDFAPAVDTYGGLQTGGAGGVLARATFRDGRHADPLARTGPSAAIHGFSVDEPTSLPCSCCFEGFADPLDAFGGQSVVAGIFDTRVMQGGALLASS
jgi:hypothetical protein